jgi:hypothetical protein
MHREVNRREESIRKLEADGYRIVNGGGTGADAWEITNWRTGELLARGSGGHEEYERAVGGLGRVWHIDQVVHEFEDVDPGDLPESLADALRDWVEGAPVEDVAAWTGWPVDKIERCRN